MELVKNMMTYRAGRCGHDLGFRVVFGETEINEFNVGDVLFMLKQKVLWLDVPIIQLPNGLSICKFHGFV